MTVSDTLDLVMWAGVCNREQSLNHVGSSESRQRRRRVKYHSIARVIPVNHLGQDSFPCSACTAFSPNSISRRMASFLVRSLFVNCQSSKAFASSVVSRSGTRIVRLASSVMSSFIRRMCHRR